MGKGNLFIYNAFAAPGVGTVERSVMALDDGGIGIFPRRGRRILQREEMSPMDSVVADGQTQGRTRSELLIRLCSHRVIDKDMSAVV